MENLKKALTEELGIERQESSAKRCFNMVYSFLLYQDSASLFESLDYRNSLKQDKKPSERYYVFRHMLRLIKDRHPSQYHRICH